MASRKAAEPNHPASDSLAFTLDSNGLNSLESSAAPPYSSPAGSEGFPASLLSPGFGGSNDDEESLLNRLGFSASPPSPPYPGAAANAAAGAAGGADADGFGEPPSHPHCSLPCTSRRSLAFAWQRFAFVSLLPVAPHVHSPISCVCAEPQFGMTCLLAVPLDYREDRDMVLRICHMHAREEAACDEAELTPLALAQKKMQMQLMQQHQLTVLQHVRTLPVDEQRAFLQSVQSNVQQAQEQRAQGKEKPLVQRDSVQSNVQQAQEQRAQGKEKPLVQRDVWETLLQQWQRQFNQTC
ncbi:unnamed protein product [Closterium sp. Yama58-4]|nr:unnamed protein product [Closterium sp. Yama58-4]